MKISLLTSLVSLFGKEKITMSDDGKFMQNGVEISADKVSELWKNAPEFKTDEPVDATIKLVRTAVAQSLPDIQKAIAPVVADQIANSDDLAKKVIAGLKSQLPEIVNKAVENLPVKDDVAALKDEIAALKLSGSGGKDTNGNLNLNLHREKDDKKPKATGDADPMLQELVELGVIDSTQFKKYAGK